MAIRRRRVLSLLVLIVLAAVACFSVLPKIPANDEVETLNQLARDVLNYPMSFHTDGVDPGVINPIAERTAYLLKTQGKDFWSHVPMHIQTTFRRFPHNDVYSDVAVEFDGRYVIDVGTLVPDNLRDSKYFHMRSVLRKGIDEVWGIDASEMVGLEGSESAEDVMDLPILAHAWHTRRQDTDWYIIADDASYISSAAFAELVKNANPRARIWFGSPEDPASIISRGAADAMFSENAAETVLKFLEFGKNALEKALQSVDAKQVERLPDSDLMSVSLDARGSWCEPLVSFGGLRPWMIQILFDRENYHRRLHKFFETTLNTTIEKVGHTYAAYYHDMVLPYIVETKPNWVLGDTRDAVNITSEDPEDLAQLLGDADTAIRPLTEREDCKLVCEDYSLCLAWQWEKDKSCNIIAHTISRGKAMNPRHISYENLVASGWMIDRIRYRRFIAQCDPMTPENLMVKSPAIGEGWQHTLRQWAKFDGPEVAYKFWLNNTLALYTTPELADAMSQFSVELNTPKTQKRPADT